MNEHVWTRPFHGIQHLRHPANKSRWATVDDRGAVVFLRCWYEGCGFSPVESRHESVTTAKTAGEAFITRGFHDGPAGA